MKYVLRYGHIRSYPLFLGHPVCTTHICILDLALENYEQQSVNIPYKAYGQKLDSDELILMNSYFRDLNIFYGTQ